MRVLIACEFSGIVRDAFAARGHDAWSCDLLPSESPGNHLQKHIYDVLSLQSWDLMIAHPPCKFLALCQAWRKYPSKSDCELYGLSPTDTAWRAVQREYAVGFSKRLWEASIPRICLENPRSILSTRLARKSQTIHPWQFGHSERKETWLWLKNLPLLKPTNIVDGRLARVHRAAPGPDRWKERSRTLQGIADAMAEQWGDA